MLDWKELIKKENLSLDELHQIPSRCNVLNQTSIKVYLDNKLNIEELLRDIPFSLDDITNENLWMSPIDSLQFDVNYHNNLPYFTPHYYSFENGLKFLDSEKEILKFLIKKMTFRQILKLSNNIQLKLSNESETEYIHIDKNNGYILFKPYPYKHLYSMGHECNYARGVMEAIIRSKDYESYSLNELFCSAKIENILKYYYNDLNIEFNKESGEFSLNESIIAKKESIDLNVFLKETFLPEIKESEIIRITENVDYKGYRIFNKGEIFNAPYCCYELQLHRMPIQKRFKQFFSSKYTGVSFKKLEDQLRIAQQKTHEANQSKYLLEQEILKKDKFLRSTSHELRTPLNGIIGLIDSVLTSGADSLSPDDLANLNTASISAWRLSRLVNDILDFSKMMEDTLILQKDHIALYQVVEFVVRNLQPLLFGKPVRIEIYLPSDLPEIWADENRLQQILFNLLGNALKFTHRGKIVISAQVQQDELLVSIKDTGIGIPGDKLESVFTEYEQGGEDISHRYGGTGLGLTVTKQLIELHGGRIWAESVYGKSSWFFFTLPIASETDYSKSIIIDADTFNNHQNSEHNGEFHIPDWKVPDNGESMIVAVDDEPINLKVIINYLPGDKYLVNSLVSGVKLLEYLKEGVLPELVILDIFMPEISGYELCSEIRKMYSSYELPVLMLTASNNLEDMVNAFSLGANDYITKPVSRGELLARVETHIKLKKSIERIELSNKKLNVIDRLVSFGFLASTFVFQNKISLEQENIILNKAYDYYKPLLDQIITDTESSGASFEKHDYFELVFSKLQSLGSQKKLNLLYEIGERVQSIPSKEFNDEDIEEISTNVFDFVSRLLFMEDPVESSRKLDLSFLSKQYSLTPKEIETVSLVFEGYSNNEIGDLMGIALNTVKQHIYHIFNKVGVENRTHLIYKLVEKR